MIVVPFKAEHYWALEPQEAQKHMRDYADKEGVKTIEQSNAYTILDGDRVIACYGWIDIYPTRALCWAYLSKHVGPHLTGVTKILHRILKVLPHKRLEMEVNCEFEQGHRWAKLLGFTMEAERLRGYRIDGGDSAIYARVR
jgi:hypothetical protein